MCTYHKIKNEIMHWVVRPVIVGQSVICAMVIM